MSFESFLVKDNTLTRKWERCERIDEFLVLSLLVSLLLWSMREREKKSAFSFFFFSFFLVPLRKRNIVEKRRTFFARAHFKVIILILGVCVCVYVYLYVNWQLILKWCRRSFWFFLYFSSLMGLFMDKIKLQVGIERRIKQNEKTLNWFRCLYRQIHRSIYTSM